MTALQLHDLHVTTRPGGDLLVRGLDLRVGTNETVALLGRSGAGKSITIQSVLGLLPPTWDVRGGVVVGDAITDRADAEALRRTRLHDLAVVLQDPRAALNPVRTVGDFATEAAIARGVDPAVAAEQAARLFAEVGLPDPHGLLGRYPHELSGGMLQRVQIAAALAGDPAVVIADEPTASLDVLSQAEVIAAFDRARAERAFGLLFVTHDLDLAVAVADRIAVLDEGRIVETLPAAGLGTAARHPATRALLAASRATAQRTSPTTPRLRHAEPVLVCEHVSRSYAGHRALDDVSLSIGAGTTLALVGGSGSGKSTLARIVAGLDRADTGAIDRPSGLRGRPTAVQMVFQDPRLSLDPRLTAQRAVERALGAAGVPRAARSAEAKGLLGLVGIDEATAARRPAGLSGGQCQRVSIARALAFDPSLLVLDEATSALDPEVRGQILALLESLRDRLGLALLLITHDLGVVARLADEVVVLHRGRVVESGTAADVIERPRAPYTQLLLDALPHRGWRPAELAARRRILEAGTADVVDGRGPQGPAGELQRA
ncbi:MAG: ABC transporter ATP-binding protein [Solirubrobacteraceae bacterium]